MNIKPGDELTITLGGNGGSFKSFLIGGKKDFHIVAGWPEKFPFPKETLRKGDGVTVRYSDEKNLYEFSTGILGTTEEPADMIILGYPSDIKTVEKRSCRRINCLVEAKFGIIFENDNRVVTGVIENISKTGCSCVIKKLGNAELSFTLGDTISMSCPFPGFAGEQTAEGAIIRLHDLEEEVHAGIRFDKELWWVPPYGPNTEG